MKTKDKIWTPPTQEDQSLKMECLKRAIESGDAKVSMRAASVILEEAKVYYAWFVKEEDAS